MGTATVRVVPSVTLDRWDVKQVLAARWVRPASQMARFGEVAERRIEPNEGGARYGSVHFDGRISRRPDSVTLKGATFLAHPRDVVFSRIDVRNGAIGVMPDEYGCLAFSSEYPVYDVTSLGRLLPDYARLLCRTKVFKSQIEAMVVGHSGRKRVSAELFEAIPIPVPSIEEQQSIVEAHRERLSRAQCMRSESEEKLREAIAEITRMLGLRSADVAPIRGAFVVDSHLPERWSVFAAVSAFRGISEELESAYPVRRLGSEDLATVSYGISKSPQNRPGRNSRPYLRVANVQDGYLDLNEIKYIDVSEKQLPLYRLEPNDVLLCEANGTLANVARPALWEGQIQDCVHQNHVLRVRTNPASLLPGYLVAYMQTAPARGHFQRRAKTTTGLNTINGTDVGELPVPVAPMDKQAAIADLWRDARSEAERLLTGASDEERRASVEAEARIAGIQSASDAPR